MSDRVAAFAPGRVNLIGEHTDYSDGLALPFAIAQGVTVQADFTGDELVVDAPGAERFARGVAAELGVVGGVRLSITADLPIGAGLASSAALAVALALALGGERDRLDLARLCSRVENEWVGAQTGLLDQTASLLGREGCALRIDFRSLREATLDAAAALPEPLAGRVRHVVEENARVDATVVALRAGDLAAVGTLLDASHASLRDLYAASTPAVERTVSALRDAGAAGARMVGGGFGGHVLALLAPGVAVPTGALAVAPSAGARLLTR